MNQNMKVATLFLLIFNTSAVVASAQSTCPDSCSCSEQHVDCSERTLSSIPSIPRSTVTFSLAHNIISEVSSIDFPVRLTLLHTLLLNNNSIRAIQRRALANLPGLQSLDLKRNRIRTIEPRTFEGSNRLTRLVLDHNLIDYVYMDSFYGLGSLVELRLENNHIQTIDVEALQQTPKLEKLYLNYNNFLILPASGPLFKALSLLTLEMDNCNIMGLSPKAFEYAPNIIYLKLRGNYLQREDLRSVLRLKSLKFLHLEFNAISYIHPNAFDGINLEWLYLTGNELFMTRNHSFLYTKFLVTLDISVCGIEDIHPGAFSNFTRLKGLYIKDNHLTTFSIDSDLESLASLDLSHNKLMYLEPVMFLHLPNLMFLDIGFNFINAIDPETFSANKKLSYLSLQSNQLTLPESGFLFSSPSLISLDLSSCGTGEISTSAFINMANLKELKLCHNALETVDFSGSLGNLTSLDISKNRIVRLHGEHFLGMNSLVYINVSENPIDCDSFREMWFWCSPTPVKIEAQCTFSHDTKTDSFTEKCKETQRKKQINETTKQHVISEKPKLVLSMRGLEANPDIVKVDRRKQKPALNTSMRVLQPNADVEIVNEMNNDTLDSYIQLNDSSSYNVSSVTLKSKENMSIWWILVYVSIGSVAFLLLVFVTTLSLDCYIFRRRKAALQHSTSVKWTSSRMQSSLDPSLRPLQGNFRRPHSTSRPKRSRQRDSITSMSRSSGEHPRYISATGKEAEEAVEPTTYRPHELWSRQFRDSPHASVSDTGSPQHLSSMQSPSAPGHLAASSWSRPAR
ncbi:leucine-rich repeats and immunoglobulin-like domains protein 1 isoform X2 [Bacillus rossius redtenbacheri]|uniref:leucine-rich repeats and immunoglobulin-like domains protein 1 isoform X2 n=1 Tax=Bacillus rossius redtenbacheri TaxID=93214 RepID=UPI002FDEFA78